MFAEVLANFHLLRPYWLLALIPIIVFMIWQYRQSGRDNPWQNVIETHLLNHMLIAQDSLQRSSKWYGRALTLAAILAILALSGPTFEKRPLPVFETEVSKVVLLDLSMSMLSEDVAPSRLDRAKFKINDLLQQTNEGSIALIVYAGDAFVISPLTTDSRTIATLIPPLSPTLMPVFGSQPVTAFKLADELFKNSGIFSG
ncbi:MAG: VWA domain-containing protein, partial [Gammaproteobacteria bacterium]|nr:VWA domain-containing protein [Gammaproteobacteria bacterium]NNJ73403.1 VWA domain-containing protein [Enterobacterales bacterium]